MKHVLRRPHQLKCESANQRACTGAFTHIHGGDVVVVGLPDLLHDLGLGQAAGLDGALHRYGPLWVVQGQVLEPVATGRREWGSGERPTVHCRGDLELVIQIFNRQTISRRHL